MTDNTSEQIKTPRVFISYSWSTPEHETWVLNLATQLVSNGVEVKLDKWDLKPGQDKYSFMEQMVNSPEIDKVLIICDKKYKEKADLRKGGVGTETQIVSSEIYEKVDQRKFVPIISERSPEYQEYLPTFIKSRVYIDLSSNENYEDSFETLLRELFERPVYNKPPLGNPPSHLFENDNSFFFKTKSINKKIENSINFKDKFPENLKIEFKEEFIRSLENFQIKYDKSTDYNLFDEKVIDNITKMNPLKEDFIKFTELNCSFYEFEIDIFVELFEKMYEFTDNRLSGQFHDIDFDNYRFILSELFLYFITILLENKKYKQLVEFLRTDFFFRQPYRNELTNGKYDEFHFYLKSFEDIRKRRLKSNLFSLTSDFLSKRTNNNYTSLKIVSSDILLHFLGQLVFNVDWFPSTYVYLNDNKIELLQKLESKKHFEKIKILFDVDKPDELKEKIVNFKQIAGYQGAFSEKKKDIRYHISPDKICTLN